MEVIRQNAGIDIAKDSFVSTLTFLLKGQIVKHIATKKFPNNQDGFCKFYKWSMALCVEDIAISFTMEATGIYYESLAYYLEGERARIHVLLPTKVKKFAESFNVKSKTDKIDSKILGQMGVERVLDIWKLSSKIYRHLRTLSRERQQIVKERTQIKNQLHAEEHCGDPIKTTIQRMKKRIKYLNKQIEDIEKELTRIVDKDDYISEKVKKIISVPGLGFKTVVAVIAETQGFINITSIRQLNSYAGYDVSIKESGKWKGKARISKKGNSHIRQAMYMPSWSSIQHTKTYKIFYERLNERKGNGLIAGTAVQKKLLGLIYTLWKNDTEYIDNYEIKKAS
ncbi:MAG: IS110 family transposase [Bacteroidales bacterium]|nr:MAG: IS110 family transposase [Bacteroidales bacterium]